MELSEARVRINEINDEMLRLFLERMELASHIAAAKKAAGLPILDKTREREILDRVKEQSGSMGCYSEKLFETLFALSREYQEALM